MTYQQPPQNLAEALSTAIALADRQALQMHQLALALEELRQSNLHLLDYLRQAQLLITRYGR